MAAQQVDLVEQVDDRKTHRDRATEAHREDVGYAEIDLLVRRDGFAVVFEVVVRLAAQAGPRDHVGGKARAAPQIGHTGGRGFQLAVVGIDKTAVGREKIRRAEVELRRFDAFRQLVGDREIAVKGEIADVIVGRQLDALIDADFVVEWCQNNRRAKLPFVEQIVREFVVAVDAYREVGECLLFEARCPNNWLTRSELANSA